MEDSKFAKLYSNTNYGQIDKFADLVGPWQTLDLAHPNPSRKIKQNKRE